MDHKFKKGLHFPNQQGFNFLNQQNPQKKYQNLPSSSSRRLRNAKMEPLPSNTNHSDNQQCHFRARFCMPVDWPKMMSSISRDGRLGSCVGFSERQLEGFEIKPLSSDAHHFAIRSKWWVLIVHVHSGHIWWKIRAHMETLKRCVSMVNDAR